jgi:hypothetical protein
MHFIASFIISMNMLPKWTFLLQSRWTKVKGLYIVARYIPFLLFTGHLYSASTLSIHCSGDELTCHALVNFIPDENPDVCERAMG